MRIQPGSRYLASVLALSALGCEGTLFDGRDASVAFPDGAVVLPDGAVLDPDAGAFMPDASMSLPSNVTRLHEPPVHSAGPSSFADGRIVDGRLIALAIVAPDETPHVAVFDPATGATRDVSGARASFLSHARGSTLSIYVSEGALHVLDGPDATPRRLSGAELVFEAWWSPDERSVLYAAASSSDAPRELFVVRIDGTARHQLSSAASGARFIVPGFSENRETRPRMSPNGAHVAFLTASGPVDSERYYEGPRELRVASLDPSGAPSGTLASLGQVADSRVSDDLFQFEFSADGSRLVFIVRSGATRGLFSAALDGSAPTQVVGGDPEPRVSMSPDRAHVVIQTVTGATVGVRRAAPDGTGIVTITEQGQLLAVSRDSRFVYVVGRGDLLRAVAIGGGAPIELQPAGSELDRVFAPLEDGRAVFTVRVPDATAPVRLLLLADPAAGTYRELARDPASALPGIARDRVLGFAAGRVLYSDVDETTHVTTLRSIALDGSGSTNVTFPSLGSRSADTSLVAASADRAFIGVDSRRWVFDELLALDPVSGALENLSDLGPPVNYADVYSFRPGARIVAAAIDHHFGPASWLLLDRALSTECTIEPPIEPVFSLLDLDVSRDESVLAFTYAPDGPWTPYRATTDCTSLALSTLLPANPAVRRIRMSPDGQWTIVEGAQLWAVRTGTNEVVQLTNLAPGTRIQSSNLGGFVISPDSQRVAYLVETVASGVVEAYAVRLDGTQTVKLNPTLPAGSTVYSSGFCAALDFSPDGSAVLYQIVDAAGRAALHRTLVDGTNALRLSGAEGLITDESYGCRAITLAPDGSRVVYAAQSAPGTDALLSVGLDGSNPQVLAQGPRTGSFSSLYTVVEPIITPDSQTVIYTENGAVWAIGLDGSARRRLSETTFAYRTTLSRDQTRVVFVGSSDSDRLSLFSAALDGSGAQDLTPSSQVNDPSDSIALTDDGFALYVDLDERAFAVPITGGASISLLPADTSASVRAVRTSPAGDAIYMHADLSRRGVFELFEATIPR